MAEWLQVIIATIIALFPIVNPFGAIPTFLTFTDKLTVQRRNQQLRKTCIYVFFILSIFLVAGNLIMKFFSISIPSIRIAGGIMLARISLNMLKAEPKYKQSEAELSESLNKEDVSFTPLAMPTLSGPGAIATTLSLAPLGQNWYDYLAMILGIVIIAFAAWLILRASTKLVKVMGIGGMNVMTRMMGFLILCVGIEFIVKGILAVISNKDLLQKLLVIYQSIPR